MHDKPSLNKLIHDGNIDTNAIHEYEEQEILEHYGTPRHSGRYPWGSGKMPFQHTGDFLSRLEEYKKQGLSEKEIAEAIGLSTTQLRIQKSLASAERRADNVKKAKELREQGYSLNEIAKEMGFKNDSSVRSLLNESTDIKKKQAEVTAEIIKKEVDKKGMIDVGVGVEKELGITKEKLKEALYILEMQGYPLYGGRVDQINNPGKKTTISVICPPGTEHKEIFDYENVHSLKDYISYDGGDSYRKSFEYPSSMDSKRLQICYAEDGGVEKDGLIELRRGVKDLSLGNSHYAQVRIMVDGTHYLKGMAVYSDDLPDGVDVRFNTNKRKGTPALGPKDNTVLKQIKNDPDNPFGSLIKEHGGQSYYDDPNGKYKDPLTGKKQSLSLINKRSEEGDWHQWDDKLPSQFLAKQSQKLIDRQLKLSYLDKQSELDEILALNNPTVKKAMLKTFAEDCDSAAVHLKAASLPRQKYQVILPVPSMKDDEVYAPQFNNGEKVALVRYPHGGTFEIPILTVNNKNTKAKNMIGNAIDAIGINSKVADRLSGADFDGDTVTVIPTSGKTKITSTKPLEKLKGFDPKASYPYKEGMKVMKNTQNEMGRISNLITDMTLKGATDDELARAVKHSMVVIDAEKHRLDYKQSEKDNGIAALKKKYQGTVDSNGNYHEGASTLLSRAKSEVTVPKTKGQPKINQKGKSWYDPNKPEGELIYQIDDSTYSYTKTYKNGTTKTITKTRTQKSTKMAEAKDARELSSGTPQEEAYADFANKMKSMANQARKEMVYTGKIEYSPTANKEYAKEVSSLQSKLNISLKNAPKERQAQIIANGVVKAKKLENDLDKKEIRKIGQQALTNARAMVGAKRQTIEITPKEWEAIQAGAITENQLSKIISKVDSEDLKELATPRTHNTISASKANKIKLMYNSGFTTSEIAKSVGLSSSSVINYLKKE